MFASSGTPAAGPALPSTQLRAAAWLAACLAHCGPWHEALRGGGRAAGDGAAEAGVRLGVSLLRPVAPSQPLPGQCSSRWGRRRLPRFNRRQGRCRASRGGRRVRRSGWGGERMRRGGLQKPAGAPHRGAGRTGGRRGRGPGSGGDEGADAAENRGLRGGRGRGTPRGGRPGARGRTRWGARGKGLRAARGRSACGYSTFPVLLSQGSGQGG